MKATLHLSNVSVVDYAYIDSVGRLIGGSYNPSFQVTGEVDSTENVVADFSNIKKRIKSALDDREHGLDHKLWIYTNSNAIVSGLTVATPYLRIDGDTNFYTHIEDLFIDSISPIRDLGYILEHRVNTAIEDTGCTVRCVNSIEPHLYTDIDNRVHVSKPAFFRYAHGLRESSAWGCQNIAHGHLSYIQLIGWGNKKHFCSLAQEMADTWNNSIFVWSDNVRCPHDNDTVVEYVSRDRGVWRMALSASLIQPVVRLPTETTVEHLAAYISRDFKQDLVAAGVHKVFVSEGLSKGAVVNVSDLED